MKKDEIKKPRGLLDQLECTKNSAQIVFSGSVELPALKPVGVATLKKNRALNASDYRNGANLSVKFPSAVVQLG